MKRWTAIVLLSCASLAGFVSCEKKEPAQEPAKPGAAEGPSPEAPVIPIDVMPKLLSAPITYPEEARQRGVEGIVHVRALVGADGIVTAAAVDTSRPASGPFGKAAVEAVEQWRFEPAMAKGRPVAVWVVVPVRFKLK